MRQPAPHGAANAPRGEQLPAKVAAAEKVWNEWVAKSEARDDAQRDAHRAKINEVQDAMIAGDMLRVVALLQKLKP